MKRGLSSFVLLLLLVPPLLALLSLEREAHQAHARSVERVLALDRLRSAELEAKAALKSALASVPSTPDRLERARIGGERAAVWAAWARDRFEREGYRAAAWCGAASRSDLERLSREALGGAANRAPRSRSPQSTLWDAEGRPLPACTALLAEGPGGSMEVSRANVPFVPEAALFSIGDFVGIGLTLSDARTNASLLVLAPEGFRGDFSHG